MKSILKSIKITLAFCVLLGICYVFVLWIFAKAVSPNGGNAEVITLNGKVVGAERVGQAFTKDIYFWGRPSAVDYNGSGSGGSNKGFTNEEYLQEVEARIDTFLVKHPYLKRNEVPSEMVTSSASGLDPDISVEAAMVQIKRVAAARGVPEETIRTLVVEKTENPLLSIAGPSRINVLVLNVALDEMK